MKKKRLWLSILLAVLMVVLIPAGTAAAEEEKDKDVSNPDFNVTVEAGLDGVVFQGKSVPITVNASNSGKDFSGKIRVIVPCDYDQEAVAYEHSIVIPSGGAKTASILIPNISNATFLRVELVNDKDKILYSAQEKVTTIQVGNEAIIGVLSDDYTGLNYFDAVSVSTGSGIVSSKMIQLNASTLPENGEGLSTCHYILIDNYNTSQLSDKQVQAILSWVNDGGILILGTGSKASTVLEAFQGNACPVTIGSLSKKRLFVAGSSEDDAVQVDAADLSSCGWEDIQNNIAPGASAWKTGYGSKGTIVMLDYDLAMEPIVSMRDRGILASNILAKAGNSENYEDMIQGDSEPYSEWKMQSAVNSSDGNKRPNPLLYAAIFLVYVLAIGPIVYLILKAKDKREKMWIIIPIIAAGFTVVVFGTSMIYRIHRPFMDAVEILEYSGSTLETRAYVTMQSPKAASYSMPLAEGYSSVTTWGDSNYDYSSLGTTNYNYAVLEDADRLSINVNKGQPFTSYNVLIKKSEPIQAEGFALNLNCTLSDVEGDVTNQTGYDLKNVVFCYNDIYCVLGDMKNGETKTIEKTDNKGIGSLSYDCEEWMKNPPSERWFFQGNESYKKAVQNQNIYKIMNEKQNTLDLNQGMVFGMVEGYSEDLLSEKAGKVYSSQVAVSYFTEVPEEYRGYTTFISDINQYMVGGNNISYDRNIYPDGYDILYDDNELYMYGETEMNVLYDFGKLNLNGALLRKHTDSTDTGSSDDELYADYYPGEEAEVWLYNCESSQYEQVFINTDEVTDLVPYIDENGWMKIRYVDGSGNSNCYAPVISLIGGEK